MTRSIERETVSFEQPAVRELAAAFAGAIADGDGRRLGTLLSESVAYQSAGRSSVASVHRGRNAVVLAIYATPGPDVTVCAAEPTEVMVDGDRAFVTVLMTGRSPGGSFAFEVGFHLQSNGELIAGITEYSGDQYTMDVLLGGSVTSVPAAMSAERSPRWFRRLRPARRR